MTSCLACVANEITAESWLRVHYNSSRSDDEQSVRGKVIDVTYHSKGNCEVTFKRKDGQKMKVSEGGRLISFGSHAPTTGFAYRYDVRDVEPGITA